MFRRGVGARSESHYLKQKEYAFATEKPHSKQGGMES
jgi:hypothetical protein